MTLKFRSTLLAICFSIIFLPAFAQAPKYSNEFLAIGVGAGAI